MIRRAGALMAIDRLSTPGEQHGRTRSSRLAIQPLRESAALFLRLNGEQE